MAKTKAKDPLDVVDDLNLITGELVFMTRDARELTQKLDEVRRAVAEIREALQRVDPRAFRRRPD